jgi:alkylhydroperoxidase family enzyme
VTRQHIPTRRGACASGGGLRLATLLAPLLLFLGAVPASSGGLAERAAPGRAEGRVPLLSDAEAWKRLPRAEKGAGQRLPAWARALAPTLPHTAAAMLELDYRHRALSPLPPKLRAKVRWVAAHALGCAYSEAHAAADLLRGGGTPADLRALKGNLAGLPEAEQLALAFARKLTLTPHAATDEEVARLVRHYGEKRVVALVLLLAYASFQDRLLLGLDLPVEQGGPLRPLEVRFAPTPLGASLAAPRQQPPARPAPPPRPAVDHDWGSLDFLTLHSEIEKQRSRRPRIRLPRTEPGTIYWGLVCRTYQPELAAAWAVCRRNFGAEANQDPVFEASVFWVVSRARQSFY